MHVQGELANQPPPTLCPPAVANGFHVYASVHNPGAEELLREVAVTFGVAVTRAASEARPGAATARWKRLHVTSDGEAMPSCEHLLLFLNDATWTRGEAGSVQLAAEVTRAMHLGVHILLAHEMPGLGGQEARGGCEFGSFFANDKGATPQELLQAGIYAEIASALRGGAWRPTSMVMFANAMVGDDGASDVAVKEAPPLLSRLFGKRASRSKIRAATPRFDARGQGSPAHRSAKAIVAQRSAKAVTVEFHSPTEEAPADVPLTEGDLSQGAAATSSAHSGAAADHATSI